MHTSFSDQLAGLDLSGFSIGPAPVNTTDFPVREAVVQTLEAVWSDLFAMVSGPRWRPMPRTSAGPSSTSSIVPRAQVGRARPRHRRGPGARRHRRWIRGPHPRTRDPGRACAMRRSACWRSKRCARSPPASTSTSSVLPGNRCRVRASITGACSLPRWSKGRDFLRARSEAKRRAAMPEGTPVIFAGGRTRHPNEADALTFANNVWATLDKVRDRVPDMVLVHGGDTKGVDRLASSHGPSDATSRKSASPSTCASAHAQASSATSVCSRSTPVMSSPFPETESWSASSSKPNPVGSRLSIAVVRWALPPSARRRIPTDASGIAPALSALAQPVRGKRSLVIVGKTIGACPHISGDFS
jgi:hypothetical protein